LARIVVSIAEIAGRIAEIAGREMHFLLRGGQFGKSISRPTIPKDIERLAAHKDDSIAALHGRRAETFGIDARLVRG
jgi:hypothetical protein